MRNGDRASPRVQRMRTVYAFLARYVEPNVDGTIDIIGADFDLLRVDSFPTTVPLAIVLKLTDLDPADSHPKGLPFILTLTGPDNTSLFVPPATGLLKTAPLPRPKSSQVSPVVRVILNLGGIVLPEPGVYSAALTLGSDERSVLVPLSLTVEQVNG